MTTTIEPRFRSGPWTGATAPTDAADVDGVAIVERLATREDGDAAVVRLANGRLAVLGETIAVGAPRLLHLFATRRLSTASAPAERDWWQVVRREIGGSALCA